MGWRGRGVWVLAGLGMLACAIPGCPGPDDGADFAAWPVDTAGYTIETLPYSLEASFARGTDVYLGTGDGRILRVPDDDLGQVKSMPGPGQPLRGLFVTRAGSILACAQGGPVWRSVDAGASWQVSLATPVWRIDQDDQDNLYTGNYTKESDLRATLYKSTDDGQSWEQIWTDPDNDHIHTVRWDGSAGRLYFAFGDSNERGQGYSDDRGKTFTILKRGTQEGHADVACTLDYVFWASDDGNGRIIRVSRQTGRSEILTGRSQFMWFAVAGSCQVYVGTMTSGYWGGERAALLASADQGATWQKLLETDVSDGAVRPGVQRREPQSERQRVALLRQRAGAGVSHPAGHRDDAVRVRAMMPSQQHGPGSAAIRAASTHSTGSGRAGPGPRTVGLVSLLSLLTNGDHHHTVGGQVHLAEELTGHVRSALLHGKHLERVDRPAPLVVDAIDGQFLDARCQVREAERGDPVTLLVEAVVDGHRADALAAGAVVLLLLLLVSLSSVFCCCSLSPCLRVSLSAVPCRPGRQHADVAVIAAGGDLLIAQPVEYLVDEVLRADVALDAVESEAVRGLVPVPDHVGHAVFGEEGGEVLGETGLVTDVVVEGVVDPARRMSRIEAATAAARRGS